MHLHMYILFPYFLKNRKTILLAKPYSIIDYLLPLILKYY